MPLAILIFNSHQIVQFLKQLQQGIPEMLDIILLCTVINKHNFDFISE